MSLTIDHSNWVIHTEAKQSQADIDNLLNQNDGENFEVNAPTSSDANVFNEMFTNSQTEQKKTKQQEKKVVNSNWVDEDEEDDDEIKQMLESKANQSKFTNQSLTIPNEDIITTKFSNSSLPGVQLALGNLKPAISYLKSQLGISKNYEQLKPIMKDIFMMNYAQIKFLPVVPPNEFILRQTINGVVYPQNGISLDFLQDMLNVSF